VALIGRPRLLVLRALGLGDLLTAVPALRALRRTYAEHELVLAAPRVLEPLVELAEVADRVLDQAGLGPLGWSGKPPDLAVNLHGRGPQSHRVLAEMGARRLVAFDCEEASHRGPAWDPGEHEVARWCRLLVEGLGIRADPRDLGLRAPPVRGLAPPGSVVIHPGAAFAARRWPAVRFAEVARRVEDAGDCVVVTGGPEEVQLGRAVAARAGLPEDRVLAGRTDLLQLASTVAAARLVVCGDTGVAHLASAFATPSVLLFGPTSPGRWGPPAGGPHEAIWHGDGDGDPWADELDPALGRIHVPEVMAAVEAVLSVGFTTSSAPRTTPGFV
jgi:ADP-heptose:LPS heptosyltransferase